jgi:cation:H+ antiporter
LILGVTALVHPLRVESATLKREYPQLLVIMLICLFMAWNLEFSRMEGFILLGGLVALTWVMVWLGKVKEPEDPLAREFAAEIPVNMPTGRALLWIVVGLLVLPLASHFLVQGSLTIARALNVSETVIGLTIVAIGTSLPEFATSLTSALRKEDDLAIGNVIGSNMFNVLGVLGAAAVTRPLVFDPGILRQDIPVMLLFTIMLFFLAYGFRGPGRIGRRSGLLMLSLFIAYLYMVWSQAGSAPGVSIG